MPGNGVDEPRSDGVVADRQRRTAYGYRNECFVPPEIMPGYMTHQTPRLTEKGECPRGRFRAADWDLLGWRYSVISAIATAPFNLAVNFLPARDEREFRAFSEADREWFRHWFDWTDRNLEILRNVKPILGAPQLGRVDGKPIPVKPAYTSIVRSNPKNTFVGWYADVTPISRLRWARSRSRKSARSHAAGGTSLSQTSSPFFRARTGAVRAGRRRNPSASMTTSSSCPGARAKRSRSDLGTTMRPMRSNVSFMAMTVPIGNWTVKRGGRRENARMRARARRGVGRG